MKNCAQGKEGKGSRTTRSLFRPVGCKTPMYILPMNKTDLGRRIYSVSRIEGSFRLRSGRVAREYFDKYLFEAQPSLLRAVARHMAELVPSDTEALAGLEMGGIPIVTLLSEVTDMPALFFRKKAKEHGTRKLVEGGEATGKRLVVVEDVVSTGGQIIESTTQLRALGAVVSSVLCVIDRESGGSEALAEQGVTLSALFTMSELKRLGDHLAG